MARHVTRQRTSSGGALIGWALIVVFAVIVVAGYGLVSPVLVPQDSVSSEDAGQDNVQEGQSQETENEDPWSKLPDLSNSPVYQTGEPIDLTGVESSNEAGSSFEGQLGWVGTMRFTVSDPVIYTSAAEAGIDYEEGVLDGYKVVAIDMTIENIDARCQPDYAEDIGGEAMLLTLFRLLASDVDGDGSLYYSMFAGCAAPQVEGLIFNGHRGSSYTWVEPGQSAQVRIGFYVTETREVGSGVGGPAYEDFDMASTDLDYKLQFSFGRYDGVPVVELGPASYELERA